MDTSVNVPSAFPELCMKNCKKIHVSKTQNHGYTHAAARDKKKNSKKPHLHADSLL